MKKPAAPTKPTELAQPANPAIPLVRTTPAVHTTQVTHSTLSHRATATASDQSVPPDPLLSLRITPVLDGRQGTNRAERPERAQISADTDIEAITAWLARFADSPNTFNSYRKEAERLLLWSTISARKPVSSLTHEDLLAYQAFLSDPQPQSEWVMAGARKVSRMHRDWRPFTGPLSAASRRQTITILNILFAWLVAAGYLAGNPLALSRRKQRNARVQVTRYLDEEVWSEVRQCIDALPGETERTREHAARVRWLFTLLYLCGLRISEVTQNTMGGFFCRSTRQGNVVWWLEITGKGGKTRIIPATEELMTALSRYRQAKGLSPYPERGEPTPLLLPVGNQVRPLTRAAVHQIVKQIFRETARRIREPDTDAISEPGDTLATSREALARLIEQASAHWLRHTAGTHMANNQIDLRHVRDNLGHESLHTTNRYLHSHDDARHEQTNQLHKTGW